MHIEKEINQLIQDCILFFGNNCYSQNRIAKYRSMLGDGILCDMKGKNQ